MVFGRAETYRKLGQSSLPVADLKAAVDAIESVRGRLNLDTERLTFFGDDKADVSRQLIFQLYTELHADVLALAYAERARSRLFLEQLALVASGIREAAPLGLEEIAECLTR